MSAGATLFRARGLVKRFGGLVATREVDLDVAAGEIHALIGPNGAGKSTLVNLISGLLPVDAGSIVLDGVDITHAPPHIRVRAGLSRCFQITSIFRHDTVLDNLRLAVQAHTGGAFRFYTHRSPESALTERAVSLAETVGLGSRLDHIAGNLPHGAQRQLDVALALAAGPKLLLLDEPMAGMGPQESSGMIELIHNLRQMTTILLIEHDMEAVFQLADRISVLVYGSVLTSGNAIDIKQHPQVQDVYLGTESAA